MKTLVAINKTDTVDDILNKILAFREANIKTWLMQIKKHQPNILLWIDNQVPMLDSSYNILTKLYWIQHHISAFPICMFAEDDICPLGKDPLLKRNIDSFEKGYFRACCMKCPNQRKQTLEKTKKTNVERYGVTNVFQSKQIKQKTKAWLQKNGVQNAFQLEEVKDKAKKTRMQKYGVEYTMQSSEKRKLASDRYKAKTGYAHQFRNPKTKEKSQQTIAALKANGIDPYLSKKVGNRKRRYQQFLKNEEVVPNFTESDFCKLDNIQQHVTIFSWHCKKCGNDFNSCIDENFNSRQGIPARCLVCHPLIDNGISFEEQALADAVVEMLPGIEVKLHVRDIIQPYELDIYIPTKKLAIEFDGLYWHSNAAKEEQKSQQYHLMKTLQCEAKEIQLVHVFENEWLQKKEIVLSRLASLAGVNQQKIFARKCIVKEVSPKESKKFQHENHLQGAINAKVNIGLFNNNQLVSLMTFSKTRFSKSYEWELVRFCTKCGIQVVGAAGKLLAYFENAYKPKSLVSYADRRWSQGKLYKALGFNFVHASACNYWYFKKGTFQLESRVKYQKHKLKTLLPTFDSSKTEFQNMEANGYYRIYDCGNLVFEKIYL